MRLDHLLSKEKVGRRSDSSGVRLGCIVQVSRHLIKLSGERETVRFRFRLFPVAIRLGVTPVPIPNTMVKPQTADDTILATVWESRRLPDVFGGVAQLGEHLPCKQGVRGSNPLVSTQGEILCRGDCCHRDCTLKTAYRR